MKGLFIQRLPSPKIKPIPLRSVRSGIYFTSPPNCLFFYFFKARGYFPQRSYINVSKSRKQARRPVVRLETPPVLPHPPCRITLQTGGLSRAPQPIFRYFFKKRIHTDRLQTGKDSYTTEHAKITVSKADRSNTIKQNVNDKNFAYRIAKGLNQFGFDSDSWRYQSRTQQIRQAKTNWNE